MIDNPAKLLPFVSIGKGQTGRVHRSSDPPVAIRHSAVQIENNRVRPGTKFLQNRITMVRADFGKFEIEVVVPAHAGTHGPGACYIAQVSAKKISDHCLPSSQICCGVWVPACAGTTPSVQEVRSVRPAISHPHGGRSSAAI